MESLNPYLSFFHQAADWAEAAPSQQLTHRTAGSRLRRRPCETVFDRQRTEGGIRDGQLPHRWRDGGRGTEAERGGAAGVEGQLRSC